MMWFAYAMVWISTAAASMYGVYLTGSATCLCALLIPLFVNMTKTRDGEKST